MISTMILSFFGIFLLKVIEIISTQTIDYSSQYDITKPLNEAIIELFQKIDSNKLAESIQLYKRKPEDRKYETANTQKLFPLGGTLYFDNIEIIILDNLELHQQIQWDFLTNKMRIFNSQLSILVTGTLNRNPNEFYINFRTAFLYKNVSIIATPISVEGSDTKIKIEFLPEYSSNNFFHLHLGFNRISYDVMTKLQSTIYPIAKSWISNHFDSNDQLLHILRTILSHQPKQKIISAQPSLLQDYDQRLHHYFIPTITHSGLTLSRIILRGLSNFESLKVRETMDHSIYTLIVKKIQGGFNLDHGIRTEELVELDFTIDCLFITVERETKRIRADARNYLIIWTSSKPKPGWLDKFSNVLMHLLENGIAASIMPSMQILSANELPNGTDMKTSIKQMLIEIAQRRTNSSSNNTKPYSYQISFKDMTIKITSASPCSTKQIQCEYLKNLQINHLINAVPIKQIHTKPGSPIAINFHGNFTSIKLAVINPNDTQGNNICEFQIQNDDIDVELLPTNDDESSMKKRIDVSMLSMVKERITRNIIPMICYPIDICDQTLKIVDDYFQNFIDKVLRTCSLRRNATITTS